MAVQKDKHKTFREKKRAEGFKNLRMWVPVKHFDKIKKMVCDYIKSIDSKG